MQRKQIKELKSGDKAIIDGQKYQVISIELSALGKQGTQKARIIATTDSGETRVIIKPAETLVEAE